VAINTPDWSTVRGALTDEDAKAAFARIEGDVERLIQEHASQVVQVHELRAALEEPGGAEMHRR
jgi:hypothetical protein